MNEDKYYHPKIDEFYYGFEFQYLNVNGEWIDVNVDSWNSPNEDSKLFYSYTESNLLRDFNCLDVYVKAFNKLRVKQLDGKDLQSLGWDKSTFNSKKWYSSFKGNTDIQLYFDNKDEVIPELGTGLSIYYDLLLFSGYIRNKSELVKLMKQLNIN